MTHVEPPLHTRYTRCNRCSHIHDVALQSCDRCGAANTSISESKTGDGEAGLAADGRSTPYSARRRALAGVVLAAAILATWLFGYGGWLRLFPTDVGEAVVVSPPRNGPAPRAPAAVPALKLRPGETFKDCEICPEMVVVPAGSFMMGSPRDERQRTADEGPQHRVTFARPFAAGQFSVTFEEWDACVADGGCNGYRPSDAGWGRGRRPVINVSWDDAKAYVAWLSRKAGKAYRLLSEAEREYVTRAGTTTPFWWGTSITTRQASYDGRSTYGGGPKGELLSQTVLVDAFEPNPWGFYQMHGNVWEWVEDCWNESYTGAPSEGSAWTAGDCSRRALRGGSWVSLPWDIRSDARNRIPTGSRYYFVGFRVGRTNSE